MHDGSETWKGGNDPVYQLEISYLFDNMSGINNIKRAYKYIRDKTKG